MKGYTPNFKHTSKQELSSKSTKGFIELGILAKHKDDCDCDKCNKDK